ncbi:MAG: GtrA family protein [Alphaproteobacteria bacterium]|nr:GtrA family protein [Alphaproteobacteria bacterium]
MEIPAFIRFAFVGALGFAVDLGMLFVGLRLLKLDVYSARLLCFAVTVTFTWALNRHVTFGEARARTWPGMAREWVQFVAVNAIGLAANYAVYAALVTYAAGWLAIPYVAAGCGSIAGLLFNYSASKRFVFGGRSAA